MKKVAMVTAGLLSLGCLGADESSLFDLNVDSSVGFSSEFVHRGRKQGKKIVTPGVELSMPVFEKGKAYLGCEAFIDVEGKRQGLTGVPWTRSEVDPYIGISYDITDIFTLDAGYVHHSYVNNPKHLNTKEMFYALAENGASAQDISGFAKMGGMSQTVVDDLGKLRLTNKSRIDRALNGAELSFPFKKDSNEIYLGVMADVLLSPSLYFFYDFDCQEVAIEGQINYTYDLSQFGLGSTALELGTKLGYDNARKPFGLKKKELIVEIFNREMKQKGYLYYGTKADLVYSFSEHAKARAGVEFAGNTDKSGFTNFYTRGEHNNFVWFNASLDCSF